MVMVPLHCQCASRPVGTYPESRRRATARVPLVRAELPRHRRPGHTMEIDRTWVLPLVSTYTL